MLRQIACEALLSGKRLELRYDGFTRVVEVHTVGVTAGGFEAISAYQVRGGSESNERFGWKTFRFDEAFSVLVIDEKSEAPRHGYKRGAKAFSRIFCEI